MKHKTAKGVGILLVLVMLMGLLPIGAAAAGDVTIDAENFPDEKFRTVVQGFDTNSDGMLSAAEIAAVTSIECFGNNISSLRGLEFFTALEELNCPLNQLTELDVSKNLELERLDCGENQLTALDVRQNTKLSYLDCSKNQLTALDVSKNPELERLYCGENQLTELDVSQNTELAELSCYFNQLTTLDVSKNPDLLYLVENEEETKSLMGQVVMYMSDNDHYLCLTVDPGMTIVTDASDPTPTAQPDDPTPPTTKPDDAKPTTKPDDTKPTPKSIENPFTDVKTGDYFYDPVLWALTHEPQITDGMTETTFAPAETCTRGQVVTFLWRAMGCAEPTKTDNPFSDVAGGDYFYKAVLWAVEKGITDGTSATTFSPNDPCTRAHVVTFLWRAENKPNGGSKNPFTDVAVDEYYTDAVLWAVEKGITDGTSDTTFSPAEPCTRGQIVTFLYRDMK